MNPSAHHQTRVRRLFDEKAQIWNEKFSGFFQNRINLFLHGLHEHGPPEARVLDFGCGTGNLLAAFAREGHAVVGVDLSADMLQQCSEHISSEGLSAELFHSRDLDPEALRESFDVIVCSSVLEYVESPVDELQKLRSMLTPSGVVLVTMPNRESNMKRRQRRIRQFSPILRWFSWAPRVKSYLEFLDVSVNVFSAEEFREVARAAGMAVRDWSFFRSLDGKLDRCDRRGCEMIYFVLEADRTADNTKSEPDNSTID